MEIIEFVVKTLNLLISGPLIYSYTIFRVVTENLYLLNLLSL